MKKRNLYGLILLNAFLLMSCGNESKKNQMQEIIAMEVALDSLHNVAFNTDSNRVSQDSLILTVQETLERLKKSYNADTIDYEHAKKLDAYKEIEDALSINSGNLAKAKQAIEDTQKKVDALGHDISKGINDRNSYQSFINFEKDKINEIENILNYYLEKHDEYKARYDSLHPIVMQLIEDLKKQNDEK